jgi:hypothetical protein
MKFNGGERSMVDPSSVDTDFYRQLSVPVQPQHLGYAGATLVETVEEVAAEPDELSWFVPQQPNPQFWSYTLTYSIGPVETEDDSTEWFSPLSFPVLPTWPTATLELQGVNDLEGEPLRDEIQWFIPLSELVKGRLEMVPVNAVNIETVEPIPADDEIERYHPWMANIGKMMSR